MNCKEVLDNATKMCYNTHTNEISQRSKRMKIFLSPSNQTRNIGKYSAYGTNECEVAEKIARCVKGALIDYDCELLIAERQDTMYVRVDNAVNWGADIYLPIHTNATSDDNVWGVETFYHSSDTDGKALAQALLNKIGSAIGKKRSAKSKDSLFELACPTTLTRAYVECDFHTNAERAKALVETPELYANAIAQALVEELNLKKSLAPEELYDIIINGATEEETRNVKMVCPIAEITKRAVANVPDKAEPEKVEPNTNIVLKRGDVIKLNKGAKVYGKGYEFSTWVYETDMYVLSTTGDRVVFSKNVDGAVTGAVNRSNITVASPF